MRKNVDLENGQIKVGLMTSGHAFTDTDNYWADVSGNQISGAGYTSGGQTLSGANVLKGSTTKWDADNISWSGATFTTYHGVIYDTSPAANDLIASIDFGGAQEVSDGTFTIEWDADGIITIS